MTAALEAAYSSYIPQGKFPSCVLFLKIHASAVDVNVHPAKLEVKFSNEKEIFDAVYYTVRGALDAKLNRPAARKAFAVSAKFSEMRISNISDAPADARATMPETPVQL